MGNALAVGVQNDQPLEGTQINVVRTMVKPTYVCTGLRHDTGRFLKVGASTMRRSPSFLASRCSVENLLQQPENHEVVSQDSQEPLFSVFAKCASATQHLNDVCAVKSSSQFASADDRFDQRILSSYDDDSACAAGDSMRSPSNEFPVRHDKACDYVRRHSPHHR